MLRSRKAESGAALIMVLWLTAALGVIGLAVGSTVRNEADRAGNLADGAKAGFLARGAIERLRYYMRYPVAALPNMPLPPYMAGQQRAYWAFPGGDVIVELLPESGKISINQATPDRIAAALAATGLPAPRIQPFVEAIVNWRTPVAPGFIPASTFWVRHASFEQIEELLLIPGVTTDLYFGYRDRLPGGQVVERPGLRDVFSVYGSNTALDVNSAHPMLLMAMGVQPAMVQQIVAMRKVAPISPQAAQQMFPTALPSGLQLRAGADTAYFVRATARPRLENGQLSDYRRTVAALISYESTLPNLPQQIRIRQWYDVAASEIAWPGNRP